MEEIIWYCTEDGCIFPNEKEARKGLQAWYKATGGPVDEDEFEETFETYYKPVTFLQYNKDALGSKDGYFS